MAARALTSLCTLRDAPTIQHQPQQQQQQQHTNPTPPVWVADENLDDQDYIDVDGIVAQHRQQQQALQPIRSSRAALQELTEANIGGVMNNMHNEHRAMHATQQQQQLTMPLAPATQTMHAAGSSNPGAPAAVPMNAHQQYNGGVPSSHAAMQQTHHVHNHHDAAPTYRAPPTINQASEPNDLESVKLAILAAADRLGTDPQAMAELQRLTAIKKRLEAGGVQTTTSAREPFTAPGTALGAAPGAAWNNDGGPSGMQGVREPVVALPSTAWNDAGGPSTSAGAGTYMDTSARELPQHRGGFGTNDHGFGTHDRGFGTHDHMVGFADGPPPAPDPSLRAPAPDYQPVANCDRVDANKVV